MRPWHCKVPIDLWERKGSLSQIPKVSHTLTLRQWRVYPVGWEREGGVNSSRKAKENISQGERCGYIQGSFNQKRFWILTRLRFNVYTEVDWFCLKLTGQLKDQNFADKPKRIRGKGRQLWGGKNMVRPLKAPSFFVWEGIPFPLDLPLPWDEGQ